MAMARSCAGPAEGSTAQADHNPDGRCRPTLSRDGVAQAPHRLIADLREGLAKVEQSIDQRVATMREQVLKELWGEDARLAELLNEVNANPSDYGVMSPCSTISPMTQKMSGEGAHPRSKWSDKFGDFAPADFGLGEVNQEMANLGHTADGGAAAGVEEVVTQTVRQFRGRGSVHGEMRNHMPEVENRSSEVARRRSSYVQKLMTAKQGGAIEEEETSGDQQEDPDTAIRDSPDGPMQRASRSSNKDVRKGFLWRFVTSMQFEGLVSVCILTNCATMGLEAQHMATDGLPQEIVALTVVGEHAFTAFFFLEFLLNWRVFGLRHFRPSTADGRANFADAVLAIGTGVLLAWVVPLLAMLLRVQGNNGAWRSLSVLRALRLARLVRVFRKVPLFREAWMLIRGLSDSARTLLWTVVVILFVTYTFAIFGIVLIVEQLKMAVLDHTDEQDMVRLQNLLTMTQGVDKMMYTLVQVLTGDSFHQFMREILIYVPFSWTYFYTYIAIASLVLMNLVTAIIVENAMETSRGDKEQMYADKEAARAKELRDMEHMFREMDADGSGTLCWDEFEASFDDDMLRKKWVLLDFRQEDCRALFDMLDNGDGEVSGEEFFEGLLRMRGVAQAKDIFLLQKMVQKLDRRMPNDWTSDSPVRARSMSLRSLSSISPTVSLKGKM